MRTEDFGVDVSDERFPLTLFLWAYRRIRGSHVCVSSVTHPGRACCQAQLVESVRREHDRWFVPRVVATRGRSADAAELNDLNATVTSSRTSGRPVPVVASAGGLATGTALRATADEAGGSTAKLAVEAILEAGSYDLGPKATRMEDPGEWTEDKIRSAAAQIHSGS